MVEVRPAGAKGNGLFARISISQGTRILAEKPLLAIKLDEPRPFSRFTEIVESLSADQLAELDALSYSSALLDEHAPGNFIAELRTEGHDPATLEQDLLRRYGVYRTNRVDMPSSSEGAAAGLCPLYARINHSCVPNVYFSWNERLGREVVHAGRDIAPGEEILGNYLGSDATFMTRAQRGARLTRYWGFPCECRDCALVQKTDAGEKEDEEDVEMDDEWDADEVREELAWLDARCVELEPSRDRSDEAAEGLEAAQELLDLLREAGLGGSPLCSV